MAAGQNGGRLRADGCWPADELANPSGLEVVLSVNGEERQRSNTENLVFTVPFLVSFLSNLMTLELVMRF